MPRQLLAYLADTKQGLPQLKANVRFWVSCVRNWTVDAVLPDALMVAPG